MCRLLAVSSPAGFEAGPHLDAFTRLCAASREYQGHGWGCAIRRDGEWELYKTVRPVWEDDFRPSGPVRQMVVHARSAFRDEGIEVENNMPFIRDGNAFIFNGEMHQVKIPVPGRTGADKLHHFISRFEEPDPGARLARAMEVVRKRAGRIRACNFILADGRSFWVHSLYDGGPGYFTLHVRRTGSELVICSEPYPQDGTGWKAVPNGRLEEFPCYS